MTSATAKVPPAVLVRRGSPVADLRLQTEMELPQIARLGRRLRLPRRPLPSHLPLQDRFTVQQQGREAPRFDPTRFSPWALYPFLQDLDTSSAGPIVTEIDTNKASAHFPVKSLGYRHVAWIDEASFKRRRSVKEDEVVAAIRRLGERYMEVEKRKMETAREIVMMQMDMEMKQTKAVMMMLAACVAALLGDDNNKSKKKKMKSNAAAMAAEGEESL